MFLNRYLVEKEHDWQNLNAEEGHYFNAILSRQIKHDNCNTAPVIFIVPGAWQMLL